MNSWEQIESIYQSALELEENQRAAFVDAACSGDEELRREVESLLVCDASAQDFMGKSALQAAAKRLAADQALSLVGRQFGAYQIVSLIGAGGMGTVYRATDTRLNRPVAIKVLHSHLSAQLVWRQRFEREARTISNLSHPHICTLYDIGREGDSDFLVEYLEGETLAQRLKNGCLPTEQVLRYTIEITSALDHAHLQGVIHRDVKPANIMLTKAGAKLLDFGLAKHQVLSSLIGDTTGGQATWSQDPPSEGDSITEEGMILGTLEYMAPEQVEGKEADARTDLFALGVVLYEMATGRKAFEGGSKARLAVAILTSQPPPMTSIHPVIPPALERVVDRCVAKDPEKRWQSASELVVEFRCIEESRSPGAVRAAEEMQCRSRALGLVADNRPGKEKSRLNLWSWLAIALVSAAAVALWFHVFPPRHKPSVLRPKVIPLTSFLGSEIEPALSPDGSQLAFVWNGDKGDNFDIYVQLIGAGTPLRLTTNPESEFSPTWSPDGRDVAFVRQSKAGSGIFLVPAQGGHERKLADRHMTEAGVGFTGLAWSADGRFLILVDKSVRQEPCSLFLLSMDSGERKRLTFPPGHSVGDGAPAVSPDGKTVAFCRYSNYDASDVYLIPFAGGEPKRLTFNQQIPGLTWTANGREIIFSSAGILWRVGISGGSPEQLAELGEHAGFSSVSIRGSRLAYAQTVFDENIWRLNGRGSHPKSTHPVKLIASTRYDGAPEYSPDGNRIAFVSDRSGSHEFWVCDSNGHNAFALASDGKTGSMSWSPDGQRFAFDALMLGHYAIYVMSAEGGVPLPLTTEGSDNVRPSWSHDGQWIYFGSNRSGDWQVWKMPAAGGLAEQVTRQGGAVAKESPDRKFLYYAKSVVLPGIPGLWKVSLTGGEEVPVIKSFRTELAGYWAMTDRGIYFVEAGSEKLTSAAPVVLSFMNFRTGRIIKITPLEGAPFYWNPGLSASRDGRSILYGSIDRAGSDIMLVENFR